MSRAVAGVLLATAAALACAQPGSPTGGPVDETPPRVIETRPAAFDSLRDLRAPVIIRFDERISERLQGVPELRDAVLVSPARGVPLVKRGRSSIEVRLADGWEADRVYRVVILPVFRDLFGNQREAPVDLVFTTGAPITEAALAGFVTDRITGEPVPDARVEAVRAETEERYLAVTDTAGFFALRYLPTGTYGLQAWVDQDRDREVDFFETQDTADSVLSGADTLVVEMALLPMDTTAAQLARAEAVDSTRVRLVFDDYFAVDSVTGTARVFSLPDTTLVTDQGRLIHGSRLDSILAEEEAEREALRAEQAARDSLQAIQDSLATLRAMGGDTVGGGTPDTAAKTPARTPGALGERSSRPGRSQRQPSGRREEDPTAPERRLPARELILLLPGPLEPDTTYYVEVDSVVNIRGVSGGGGAAAFRTAALPDTAAADSASVDTTSVDSTTVPPPDTLGPDTVQAAPDSANPDSASPDSANPDTVPPARPAPVEASGPVGRRP